MKLKSKFLASVVSAMVHFAAQTALAETLRIDVEGASRLFRGRKPMARCRALISISQWRCAHS